MRKGWEIKKLGDVIEIKNGRNQKHVISETGPYPIMGSAGNTMGYSTDYICEAGTTIIGRKGNISKPLFINERFWNVDTAFGFYPNDETKVDKKLIYYLCLSIDFESLNRGTTIPSLVKSELQQIEISLPKSLSEQKNIVSVLDETFAAIDQAKENLQRNLQNAKELFESELNNIFLTEGKNWEKKKLNQIAQNLDNKRIPITKNVRSSGEYPYYGASGIVDYVGEYIFDEDLLLVSEDGANLLARTYPIAFSVSGKTWVNNHAHVLRFESMVSQKFVEYYLNSIKLDDFVSGMAQPKLNQTMLNTIPIPFPKVEVQKRVLDKLDSLSTQTKNLEKIYQKKIDNLEELKKSILQKHLAAS